MALKPKRGPGRPKFKPTLAQRRMVEELIGVGTYKTTIARALKISDETLDAHFQEEILNGAAKKHAESVALLWKSAKKGSFPARKHLSTLTALAVAKEQFVEGAESPEKAEAEKTEATTPVLAKRLGKKEQQREDAIQAGQNSVWGDDLKALSKH